MTAVFFVALLSPIVQNVPGRLTRAAGRAGWLSALIAGVPILVLAALYCAVRRKAAPLSCADIVCSALGEGAGRAVLVLIGAWLAFYSGFALCSGADRFVSTILPSSKATFFIIIMYIMALVAALGDSRAIARCAMVFRPALMLVFIIVFAFALPEADANELLPVSRLDTAAVFRGAVQVLGLFGVGAYLFFLEPQDAAGGAAAPLLIWLGTEIIIVSLMCVTGAGLLGVTLTQSLPYAFFAAIRDLHFLGAVERIEAVIIALWIFSDFILISAFTKTSALLLCRGLGVRTKRMQKAAVWLCSAASLAAALAIDSGAETLVYLTENVVPRVNFVLTLAILPCCFIIWTVRSRNCANKRK
jgi:hypothetical protein